MSAANTRFLRSVVALDATSCAAMGLLMTLAARPLADLSGLPVAISRPAGIFLLVCAAGVAWLASRPVMPRRLVWALVVLNGLWVIESVLLMLIGKVELTGLGYGFVIAQAAAVALLAELEVVGLRRAARPIAA